LNDFCVKSALPWVFAGVVGAEAQVMSILPGRTACLRCVYDSPAPPCVEPTCRAAGVLGPAVAAIAALQAMEAVKILSGHLDQVSPYLTKFNLWTNEFQRIDATTAAVGVDCPCCKRRQFDFLEGLD
jgi:adenylyltransferase/sulfurtransferase